MSNPLRILLVEEDPDVALLIRSLLSEAGHTVTTVAFGIEALSRVATADVVLVDFALPDTTGIEVARAIKDLGPETAAVPVLLIAGQGDPLPDGGASPEGCAALVPKSMLVSDLVSAVGRVAGQAARRT